MKYQNVFIFGHGRSGTNWLSRVLDFSRYTHCRIEPNELVGNPLGKFPDPWVVRSKRESFFSDWNDAVKWTHQRFGERDWLIAVNKEYLQPFSKELGLYRIMAGEKNRKLTASLFPRFGMPEYVMPPFIIDKKKLYESMLVMKLNQAPEWGVWLLINRPKTCVIQIVRHPGGVLNSWKNRYLSDEDRDMVLSENHRRLEMIASYDAEWASLFGNIRLMGLVESELWFWRYASEMIHRAGEGKGAYILCLFETLADNCCQIAKRIYHHLGLEWNQTIEQQVKKESKSSTQIASKWRDSLSDDEIEIVEKVLDGSPMQHWWEEKSVNISEVTK